MPLGKTLLLCRTFGLSPSATLRLGNRRTTATTTVLTRLALTPLSSNRKCSFIPSWHRRTRGIHSKRNRLPVVSPPGSFLQFSPFSATSRRMMVHSSFLAWLTEQWSTSLIPKLGYTCLVLYVALEVAFYFYFHYIIVPRANKRTTPNVYLDYPEPTDRHKLIEKILTRLEQQAVREQVPVAQVLSKFFIQWFTKVQTNNATGPTTLPPGLVRSQSSRSGAFSSGTVVSTASSSSSITNTTLSADDASSISSTEGEEGDTTAGGRGQGVVHVSSSSSNHDNHKPLSSSSLWSIPGVGRTEICTFLAWAMFAKEYQMLTNVEWTELSRCLQMLQIRTGLVFPVLKSSPYQPRRLSLEDVSPLHRPFLVYMAVEIMRFGACLLLRWNGFVPIQHHQEGVTGWYRPGKQSTVKDSTDSLPQLLPLVFFHGIAPAGLAFYLPMIHALINDGRPALLVEQVSISGRLGTTFDAVDETEMMQTVEHMIKETIDADPATRNSPLLWAGHSFGSCPLAWMLRHETLKKRTAGLHLLDPVTILLSEPDVMNNFLYNREISKIRMVAASELYTEMYLRRHFAWYNAEAWVDEKSDYLVTVALSECDEIVNSPKVAAYLSQYPQHVRTIYWSKARHAHCVSSPSKWRQLQQSLWQQETAYWQKQTQKQQQL